MSESEEADQAREEEAAENIEKNEEEGAPQFPGDTGVAPDQGGEDQADEAEEGEAEEETKE